MYEAFSGEYGGEVTALIFTSRNRAHLLAGRPTGDTDHNGNDILCWVVVDTDASLTERNGTWRFGRDVFHGEDRSFEIAGFQTIDGSHVLTFMVKAQDGSTFTLNDDGRRRSLNSLFICADTTQKSLGKYEGKMYQDFAGVTFVMTGASHIHHASIVYGDTEGGYSSDCHVITINNLIDFQNGMWRFDDAVFGNDGTRFVGFRTIPRTDDLEFHYEEDGFYGTTSDVVRMSGANRTLSSLRECY